MLKTIDITPAPEMSVLIDAKAEKTIDYLLEESLPLSHPDALPARKYLSSRGLDFTEYPVPLRYYSTLPYYPDGEAPSPAIIAGISNHGILVGLHRTYITLKGQKISKKPGKKIFPVLYKSATSGGAIQLYEPGETLLVAEGIETSLAVHEMLQEPVWAATSSGAMALMEIPVFVKSVIICADNDKNKVGQAAATKLGTRLHLQGKEVHILTPQSQFTPHTKSIDWLDCLVAMKKHGH